MEQQPTVSKAMPFERAIMLFGRAYLGFLGIGAMQSKKYVVRAKERS